MMVGITTTWSDCQSAVYPAQSAGMGFAIWCESVLHGKLYTTVFSFSPTDSSVCTWYARDGGHRCWF